MVNCYFPGNHCNLMGKYLDNDFGSRYNRTSGDNGWYGPFTGVLFYHAVVEDSVAKLKYVQIPFILLYCSIMILYRHVMIFVYVIFSWIVLSSFLSQLEYLITMRGQQSDSGLRLKP